jgi:hypothetical protein
MPAPLSSRTNGRHGGRKKGAVTLLTRQRADELAAKGETPLDVMIRNMLFWVEKANYFGAKLEALVVDAKDPAARAEAMKLVKDFLEARQNSQLCAVDAAPYCHPKLHAIDAKNALTLGEKKIITLTLEPGEASKEYTKLVSGG